MNKPASYEQTRINKRNLPDVLVHKFLTEYGYDHGPVIARAIVDDLLATLQQAYPDRVPPKTITWLAVRRDKRGHRKGLTSGDLIPIRLNVVTEAEVNLLTDPALGNDQRRRARPAFNKARFVRWCHEAYQQGAVLTHLDLSLLSGLSTGYISYMLRQYEAETGEIVPTRGTVHDIGPAVTHKAEVIRRWLRHELPAQIARAVNHSQEAVDRYIADYQKVRLLAQKFSVSELSTLSGLTHSVVHQYLDLLKEYEPDLKLYDPQSTQRQLAA